MTTEPKPSTSGTDQSATRPGREPRFHGEVLPGDMFTWCGHLLLVEAGSVALGMPIRKLTLNVSEPTNGDSRD